MGTSWYLLSFLHVSEADFVVVIDMATIPGKIWKNEKRHRFTGDRLAGCDRLWLSGFWMFLALRFIMVYRSAGCPFTVDSG